MSDDLGLGIMVSMKDACSQNAGRIENSVTSLDKTVAGAADSMNRNMELIQKGTMMMGAGLALLAMPAAFVASTVASERALGELASLGVQDLNAIAAAAEDFTNQWAGTNRAEFIGSTYDVKSALSSLSDEAVGVFTSMAALTAKATKATTDEMVGTFTTAYGIFKPIMADMTDMEWATAFSGAMSQTVASFKTNGKQMADAIKNIGAVASSSNIPLQEQLAVLGQLQTTMPGSEAGTLYKAFIMKAAEAGEKMGLKFIGANGQLRGVIPILNEIKKKFPDLSQAAAQVELKKAFGSDEAVKFVLQMSSGMEALEGNIQSVEQAMRSGTAVTEEMANAMNMDVGARFTLIKQQVGNLFGILGKTLLPVIMPILNGISKFVLFLQKAAKAAPGLTRVILTLTTILGIALVVVGGVIVALGTFGMMLPAIKAGIIGFAAAASSAGAAVSAAFLPVTAIVAAIILAVFLLKKAWETDFGGIRTFVTDTWNKVSLAFNGIKELCTSLSGGVGTMSAGMAEKLKQAGLYDFVVTVFMAFHRIREFLTGLWNSFKKSFEGVRKILEPMAVTLVGAFKTIGSAIFTVLEALGLVASSGSGAGFRSLGSVIGTVLGLLLKIAAILIRVVLTPFVWGIKIMALLFKAVALLVKGIIVGFKKAGGFLAKFFFPLRMLISWFKMVITVVKTVWQVLTGKISVVDGLKQIGGAVFEYLATPFRWIIDIVTGVWSFVSGIFTSLGNFLGGVGRSIMNAFLNLPLISTLKEIFGQVKAFFNGDISFFEMGRNILIAIGKGIWSAVTFPFTMLKNALGKLRDLLPFSDAKEGPLSSLTQSGKALLETFAAGIDKAKALPGKILDGAVQGIGSVLSGAGSLLKAGGRGLLNLFTPKSQPQSIDRRLGNPANGVNAGTVAAAYLPYPQTAPVSAPVGGVSPSSMEPGVMMPEPFYPAPVRDRGGNAETADPALIAALLEKLDALGERPIEVAVESVIDGRRVAEAVHRQERERHIRNYGTL